MARKRTRANTLSPAEASRALYIDFEGGKRQHPVLLGWWRRASVGEQHQARGYVVDPLFRPLGDAHELAVMSLGDAVADLLLRARSKGRVIVAWSTHERDIVGEYAPEHLARFDEWFVNGKLVAERWMTRCHPDDKPSSGKLIDYLGYIGRAVPERAGIDRTGTTIRRLRAALESGRRFESLTNDQRRRWADLLEHNAYDIAGTKEIMLRATRELAAEGAS